MDTADRMQPLALLFFFTVTAAAGAPLAITNVIAHQMEDGPLTSVPKSFVTGEVVFLSFQLDGYKVSPDNRVKLSYLIDALDPKGVKIVETIESNVDSEVTPQDKEWKPKVRQQIVIPPLALPGVYKFVIKASDDQAKTTAEKEHTITVTGHQVAESPTLVIRNFGFYRSEDDRKPLAPAAYRPGDAIWARFDITGFQYGPTNRIEVEYGISVLSPGGKVLFTQEQAAVERSESFYPKRYIPSIFSLRLQPGTTPGEYSILLTARDHIGGQTYEQKETFSVE
jgi:hypothetical protein